MRRVEHFRSVVKMVSSLLRIDINMMKHNRVSSFHKESHDRTIYSKTEKLCGACVNIISLYISQSTSCATISMGNIHN